MHVAGLLHQDRAGRAPPNLAARPPFGATALDASIVNISRGGVCLRMSRAFSVGTNLSIILPTVDLQLPPKASVCWIHQTSDHSWLLGCMFAPAMKEEQLQVLMNSYLPKTETERETPIA
jgi:hypothetical protein